MSSTPLQDLWDASASQPFAPTIDKSQQFTVGFGLLFAALVFTGLFGLSKYFRCLSLGRDGVLIILQTTVSRIFPCMPSRLL